VRFSELTAQGLSFAKIAQELKVSKPTLIKWSEDKELQRTIKNLQAIKLEALQVKVLRPQGAKVELVGEQAEAMKAELAQRDLSDLPTHKPLSLLLRFAAALKAEEAPPTFQGEEQELAEQLTSLSLGKVPTCSI